VRKKIVYLGGMFAIFAAVAIMIYLGLIDLPSFWTQLAATLIPTALVLGYLAFKTEIDDWINSIKNKKQETFLYNKIKSTMVKTIPTIQEQKLTRIPPSIKNGISHYENRSQLPFYDMISKAEQSIEMSAMTFTISILSHYNILKGILSRKVHITFLLQSPDSSSIATQREIYYGSRDLDEQIRKSLGLLCDLKKEFKDLVIIRLYHSLSKHSITIIDRDNPDKAWIQVESRLVGSDTNSRPIDVAYRKENEAFFNQYSAEYTSLLNDSKPYECRSTF
jgi:hypothetical protein